MPPTMLPNPIPLPAWIQTLLWAKWPTHTLDFISKRFEEPFTVRMIGKRRYVMVNSPAAVKAVMTEFPHAGNEELRPFLGDHSLFLLRGQAHEDHRRVMQPLLKGEEMLKHGAKISEIVLHQVASLKKGQRLNVAAFAQSISIQVLMESLFGINGGQENREIKDLLLKLNQLISGPFMFFHFLQRDLGPLSTGRKFKILLGKINEALSRQIASGNRCALGDSPKRDLIYGMLVGKEQIQLSQAEVLDEAKTLLAAGYEPIFIALTWALYWIHANPHVLERLLEEVRQSDNADPAAVGTNVRSYLDVVCRETLRIIPIVPTIERMVTEATDFFGHRLSPGTSLVACSYLTHRREDIYTNASSFKPERFLTSKYSPYEYYPFGGGNRRCLGAFFALFELKIMLWAILRHARFSLNGAAKPHVIQNGATLGPAHNLTIIVDEALR